jgi:multiple sugar transport system substrate-binding protein
MSDRRAKGSERPATVRAVTRREFLATGSLAVAGLSVLAACGGSSGGGGGGGGNLILTHGPEDSGTLQKQLDRWNSGNHGFKVTWRKAPADSGQYFDQLRTQFQAGGGDVDVISGDVVWPAQLGANGWVEDLTSRFNKGLNRSSFLPGPIQAVTWNGKTWALPWFTDLGMLWYRTDFLQSAGVANPPKTFEELTSIANEVRAKLGVKYGIVFQGAAYEGGVCNGLEDIWNSGGDVLDRSNAKKVVIDSPQAAAGLSAERGLVASGVAPQAVSTFKEMDAHTAFLNGDSVFMRNWPYVYGLIGKQGTGPNAVKSTDQVGLVPLPVSSPGGSHYSCLGGWNLFINAASQKKDQAWELMTYLAAPEQVKERTIAGGYLSPLTASYSDQDLLQKAPVLRLAKEIAPGSRARPVSPVYSDLSLKMQTGFNDSLKGTTLPDQEARTLQGDLQSIVDRSK